MPDITEQLRDYLEQVVEPVEVEDVVALIATRNGLVEPASNERDPHEGEPIMVDLQIPEVVTRRSRMPALALAAAALVLVVALAVILRDDSNTTIDTLDSPSAVDEPASTAPAAPPFGSETALATVDAYFAANSAGDFEELRALFADEPAFTGQFGIAEDEQVFAWNAAQGTTVSPPECSVVDAPAAQTLRVNCQAFNHDALVQAVDGPPVPIFLTLRITPDGIVQETGSFGQPDFNTVGIPFDRWMAAHHPDDRDNVRFGNWTTIEEARRNGTLTAQYAKEWADYLEANGCAYNDDC